MKLRSFLTLSLVLAGCRATVATGPGAPPPPQPEVRDHRHREPPPPPPPAPPPPVVNDHRAPPPAPPAPPPPAAPVWNSTGWVMIGSSVLDAAKKTDRINVDKSVGKFDELTLVVTDGDLQLNSMKITFNNSSTFAPPVTHQFREGQRTRAIDLPGADRSIARVDVEYANATARPRIEIWARNKAAASFPWDTKGWTQLGMATVAGKGKPETQKIKVGKAAGEFSAITLFVPDSDVQLDDVTVVFGDSTRFSPKIKQSFKEGQRSRAIDLPGKARGIDHVELTLVGGTNTHVQLWGRKGPGPK